MLRLRDAFTLAWTKLLSRKFWTSLFLALEVTLLAGVLIFASCIQGLEGSLAKFDSEGLNGRYLVTAANSRNNPDLEKDPKLMDLAEELYQRGIEEHRAVAQKLGLEYSADSEIAPTEYNDGKRELVPYSPYAKQAMDIMMRDYLVADKDDLEKILENYPYQQIFVDETVIANGRVVNLENGVENLKQYTSSIDNMRTQVFNGLHVIDEELYQDYLFKDVKLENTAIPVVVSVEQAETILGISSIGSAASSEEKIQHFEELKSKSSGMIIEACYRNGASQEMIFKAQQILDEIARNKDKPYYTEPSLIYNLPESACGATTVKKDTRTAEEKKQDQLREEYQKAIGSYEAPKEQPLKFQIVGLIPVSSISRQSNDILGMIQSLGGVSIATPIISRSYYDGHVAELSEVYDEPDTSLDYLGIDTEYIIEFNDAKTAREFIDAESCEVKGAMNYGCATEEHRFLLTSDSNNSLVIEDISRTFTQILIIIALIVLGITVIFVALMVVRSITNDRKEIAIFRAIGFRRTHILQVYLMYALILATIIVGGGVILSLVAGFVLNPWLSGVLTEFLRATFFTLDSSIVANLFVPQIVEYLCLGGAIIGVSLLSALLPALIKSRQNIIDGLKFE